MNNAATLLGHIPRKLITKVNETFWMYAANTVIYSCSSSPFYVKLCITQHISIYTTVLVLSNAQCTVNRFWLAWLTIICCNFAECHAMQMLKLLIAASGKSNWLDRFPPVSGKAVVAVLPSWVWCDNQQQSINNQQLPRSLAAGYPLLWCRQILQQQRKHNNVTWFGNKTVQWHTFVTASLLQLLKIQVHICIRFEWNRQIQMKQVWLKNTLKWKRKTFKVNIKTTKYATSDKFYDYISDIEGSSVSL